MPFTVAQLHRLARALENNNLEDMDAVIESSLAYPVNPKFKHDICFLTAVNERLFDVVVKYLENRAYDKVVHSNGLRQAIAAGHLKSVQVFIEACEVDPNAGLISEKYVVVNNRLEVQYSNNDSMPPIIYAAGNAQTDEHLKVLEYLIKVPGLDINAKCDSGDGKNINALFTAVAQKNANAVRILLEAGCDPYLNASSKAHNISLGNAFDLGTDPSHGTPEIARLLQQHKQKQAQLAKRPAATAPFQNNVSSFLDDIKARRQDEPSSVHSSGSDSPPRSGERSHSSTSSSPASASSIPPSPPREDSPPRTALPVSGGGQPKIIPPIFTPEMPQRPLSEKAKRILGNAETTDSAFIRAVGETKKEICDQGLTFTYFNRDGWNVFQAEVYCHHFELTSYMLARYPHAVDTINAEGKTALIICVSAKDLFANNTSHDTAHRQAVRSVEYLLAYGADVSIRDNAGNTALYYAEKNKFFNVVDLLKKHSEKLASNGVISPQKVEQKPLSRPIPAPAVSAPSTSALSNGAPILFRTPNSNNNDAPKSPTAAAPASQQSSYSSYTPPSATRPAEKALFLEPAASSNDKEYAKCVEKKKSKNIFGKIADKLTGSSHARDIRP